jgi:hypothetical protein
LIPVFDPAKDDARIEHWVERVDSLAERYRWDDDTIIRLIASRLKGNARQWYDEQTRYDATCSHIRNNFVAQFRKSVPFSKLLKEAAKLNNNAIKCFLDFGSACTLIRQSIARKLGLAQVKIEKPTE